MGGSGLKETALSKSLVEMNETNGSRETKLSQGLVEKKSANTSGA